LASTSKAVSNGNAVIGNGKVPSVSFSKLASTMAMPNMLDVQVRAFRSLLQTDAVEQEREDVGLERVFTEVFPITDVNNKFSLEYVNYSLGEPKYSVEECIERDMTFAAPLKATLRLVVWEESEEKEEEERRPKDIIEKEVYLGDLPLLTDLGTFIINGSERVIVSQLHRSPGVVFEESVHPNGTKLFSARIIPFRGSWVEFTVDIHDVIYVHIDKKKKFPATALLRAFGYGRDEDVLRLFYSTREIELTDDMLLDQKVQRRDVFGLLLAEEVVDPETGEVIAEIAEELTTELFSRLRRADVSQVKVFSSGEGTRGESPLLKNTLRKDPTSNEEDALRAIYTLLRPGEAPNIETARVALERIFFNPKRYDLGRVGRYKINQRLGVDRPPGETVLTQEDFIAIFRYLIELNEGRGFVDDIDHLGNRRIRSVGELIANQFSVGLSRMARLVKERMSITTDVDKMNIDDLVNARTVSAVIQAFFGSSQLSQFMDQTNPLAELTHKRRLSALGPGGLTRERAGFEVRDVHYSHYGRMCPIETPEGPNIGLISSLTTYARVNDLGFIETPYRKVVDGQVTDDLEWLDANAEENASIAQANAPLNDDGTFRNEFVLCRQRGDFPLLPPDDIDYMDVAPDQLVSVAAALIPFLEHDDANRALMGSNMQRQAVPLLHPVAPLVGTGLEEKIARDSGAVILAKRSGIVQRVTADEIIIDTGVDAPRTNEPLAKLAQYDRYRLKKYWRTNQDTAINQRPLVTHGQRVEIDDIIADGASTDHGEIALGRNVVVAFMPWYGHNFEDAIVLSEKLVKDDVYTSIHIQELELHVRDTKRGMEEITREIPNVAEESLTHLDERGIVRIGARVHSGDILVGKITPKGETELSPEEKLLTAIFGEKAKDVKDSSLKMPPGMEGTIIDVKVFSRRIDDPLLEKERGERIGQLRAFERDEILRISDARDEEVKELLSGQTVTLMLKRGTVEPYLEEGTKLGGAQLADLDLSEVDMTTLKVQNRDANERMRRVITEAKSRIERVRERTEEQIDKVFQPDELSPGVVQLVKVYIAEKRKVSVGDKMAGRHGNKGIVARIVPEEDLPFLPDGTPVDIVLNPLGVPSRMNVGQILETTLGWACKQLGFEAKTPVFQGATEDEIGALLKVGGLRWAHGALGVSSVAFPELAVERIVPMMEAIYQIGGGEVTALSDTGNLALGRSLDEYLGHKELPKDSQVYFEEVRDYLVAAREELMSRAHEGSAGGSFTAIESLGGKKALRDGLDDAIVEFLTAAGLTTYGKVWLRDGRTGEKFDYPVTVGVIYMLKLSHLVDDKIHARSIGPYSLVTQQPLAGKAQFGGQRFGEMEVWALEAYGAAHTLQEILTVKSDDVAGRSRVYEAIVKGENLPEPGIPESFNVLVKELQSLGLSVTLGRDE
jgi:DNA-directed RNA polymerase subunit beta